VTLTLRVAIQLLRSAYCFKIVITRARLFFKVLSGLKVIERTRKCYGRTDGRSDGGHSYISIHAVWEGVKF
jgi:predicted choloylglycine hydrolase